MLQPTECRNIPVYDELNKLIFEFLELNGLEKTLGTFAEECKAKALPCPKINETEEKAAFSNYEAERMMKAFDEGDLQAFLKLWAMFQTHIQVTSSDMKKLEVYIRVHFALWPRAHGEAQPVQLEAMSSLKAFFEDNSLGLSGDPAILPLFALPFVTDPFTHPIFKDLFQDNWTQKLRGQLESTILKYFELLQENICHHSRLAELIVKGERYEGWKSETNAGNSQSLEVSYHQDRFYQLLANHRKIRKLLQGTRESYAKLLLVTSEVVNALEVSIKGEKVVSLDPVLEKCYYIFPEIFTPKDALQTGKPNVEYFKRLTAGASFDPTQDSDVSLFFLNISDLSPESLDYQKVKETLVMETTVPSDKLCVMQALRWMITKTNDKCRQFSMDAFVANDLLGICSKKAEYRQKLFQCMLSPTPTYQKECFARLLNAFSSTRAGRNYISINTFAVEILVKSLPTYKGPNESFICQMVIASLQKLSLKKNMRLYMINHKVINWLIVYIKSELACEYLVKNGDGQNSEVGTSRSDHFNPYLMEYGWALLMNLCLHEEAWESCAANGIDILTAAANMLLTIPRKDMAPYVVSTLYSLLRSPDMFSLAKSMKIETAFAPLLATESDVSQHLNHLVSLLYKPGADRITSSRETNYDDEENPDPDVFEPELELPESWTNSMEENALWGDDLLLRQYMLQKEEAVVPVPLPKSAEPMKGVIIRPVTPSKLRNNRNKSSATKPATRKAIPTVVKGTKETMKVSKSKVPTTTSTTASKLSTTITSRTNSRTKSNIATPKSSKSGINSTPKVSKGSKDLNSQKKGEDEVTYYTNIFHGSKVRGRYEVNDDDDEESGSLEPGLPITFTLPSDN